MAIAKILPRLEIKNRDNQAGKFPSIARTGDKRLGNQKIFFDDTNTIIFDNTSFISYPTL